MRVRKKIADIYKTNIEMERVKKCVVKSKGRKVMWEKHRDGRKRQQICSGVIGEAFKSHFSVNVAEGRKESFNYIDLLIGEVVLMDEETGENILKQDNSVDDHPTWEDIRAMDLAKALERTD